MLTRKLDLHRVLRMCHLFDAGSQKFKYIPGTTYHFAYVTNTITGMEDASEDSASISVAATANVHVLSECDMVLQVRIKPLNTTMCLDVI